MTFEDFLSILDNFSVWSLVKIFILLALLLYIIFSMVVMRQVSVMSQALDGMINIPIKLFARAQLILAVVVFVLALLIL